MEREYKKLLTFFGDDPFEYSSNQGYSVIVKKIDNLGYYCGYVKIPNKICDILQQYDVNIITSFFGDIECHYGITYVCPKEMIIGFDCAHSGDFTVFSRKMTDVVRSFDFVHDQIELICQQLEAMCNNPDLIFQRLKTVQENFDTENSDTENSDVENSDTENCE